MKLLNLRARPKQVQRTIELIEESFGYAPENSFAVDFYPLMRTDNLENCWVVEVDGAVVAHSGAMKRCFTIDGKAFPVIFIGGVAVDKKSRGKGYSSILLRHILSLYADCAFFI